MSAKGREAKVLTTALPQKASSFVSPDLSGIEKASFLKGLQINYDNPMHSTAMEEDFVFEEGQMDKRGEGKRNIPKILKATDKQHAAAVKRKTEAVEHEEKEEEEQKKRSRKNTGGKVKTRSENGPAAEEGAELDVERKRSVPHSIPQKSSQPALTANSCLEGREPARRKSDTGPEKKQQLKKNKKRESELGSCQSEGESDSGTAQQNHRRVPSSDEEVDTSWKPSPQKAMLYSLVRTRKSSSESSKFRKSSSGSASEGPERFNTERKRHCCQGGTEEEVVLDAFLDFCDQYRESVESKAVKQSIDSFSNNVKDQLLEKISSCKELRVLKKENAKVGSLICKKTPRLLDAKHELMRAERQVWLVQKEKAKLKLRLADLRQGHAFLHDIRELNRQYLDYRHKHPKENETYGATSLPALLLEAKLFHAAEKNH